MPHWHPETFPGARLAGGLLRNENDRMEGKGDAGSETPEQTARSIADALDFLHREAEAAGLVEVAELIGKASSKAKKRKQAEMPRGGTGSEADLRDVCVAIVRLPSEYRKALILKKVYGRSYAEIARECSISVATARDQVMRGFRLVRGSLPQD